MINLRKQVTSTLEVLRFWTTARLRLALRHDFAEVLRSALYCLLSATAAQWNGSDRGSRARLEAIVAKRLDSVRAWCSIRRLAKDSDQPAPGLRYRWIHAWRPQLRRARFRLLRRRLADSRRADAERFAPSARERLMDRFNGLEISSCPFGNLPESGAGRWGQGLTAQKMRDCVWLRPVLVGARDVRRES